MEIMKDKLEILRVVKLLVGSSAWDMHDACPDKINLQFHYQHDYLNDVTET